MWKEARARSCLPASTRRRFRNVLVGLLYVSPFLAGFLAWRLLPLLYAVWLTLHSWDLLSPPKYVGLENFRTLFGDALFRQSLSNTAFMTLFGVPVHLILALLLALALNVKLRGRGLFRTIFYLPSITPAVAGAVIWGQIFQPEFGILNTFLHNFGIAPIKWLWDPSLAKPAFILMACWGIGPQMVIFLAGLQGIPEVLYEAARIDGANRWSLLRHVTLPMLSPVVFFNLVMGAIGALQIFTSSFILTAGGPQNATLFAVLYIYRNAFQYFEMGYAALLAWAVCLIILLVTILQFHFGKRWVYYEAGVL